MATNEVRAAWNSTEVRALVEARSKLERRVQRNVAIGVVGLVATVGSFVLLPVGGIVFFGAMIAGPLYAIDARRKLRNLDRVRPGTPLNAKVLGVTTFVDPPRRANNRVAVACLGILIAALFLLIVVALALK